jgi:hypothetical protein
VDLPGNDETAGLTRYTGLVVDAIGSRPEVVLVAGSLRGFTAPLVCGQVSVRELVLVNAMVPDPGETVRDWWTHTGALEAQTRRPAPAVTAPSMGLPIFCTRSWPRASSISALRPTPPFESVCDFKAWPAIGIRVLAGIDDRYFPVGLQRRVARDRLGVEADVLPGGQLLPLVQPRLVADYLLQTTRGD